MRIVQEKLERFSDLVMSDVTSQKDALLGTAIEAYQTEYDRKETEYLEEAYKTVQAGLKKIDKEKQEIISRAIMENQTRRLQKRTEVVDGVFNLAIEKLKAFAESDGYKDYLIDMIESDLKALDSEDVEILINYADERLLPELNIKFNGHVRLESKNVAMIGGCKLHDGKKGYFIDDSFAKRLSNQRNDFMQVCRVQLDAQD